MTRTPSVVLRADARKNLMRTSINTDSLVAASISLDGASNGLRPLRMWLCSTAIAPDVGLLQDQVLSLPHRSQGVGLPRFCHNSLCRRGKPFRAACANRYDMLPWGQSAIVGVTLCDRSHACTIYHHSEGLSGSKFGASL